MDENNFKSKLIKILKQDQRLVNDKGELRQNLVKDFTNKFDEQFIQLLLDNEITRTKFFLKVKDVYVFKQSDLKFFLDENKLDNSYTQLENRIGLQYGSKLLKDYGDVVLNFPYKDCVLEGGQSTEEGLDTYYEYEEEKTKTVNKEKVTTKAGYKEKQAKRKEIFFNQILARDEIDRLEEPKAFKNFKKYSKKGEETFTKFNRNAEGTITDNLIIKGNNLLALHSLKKEFTGKVKLIYIDPPYNTGGNGDTFEYNNNFKRSTWLTFMKNRLEVAKELLTSDGAMIIAIDENEQAYLGVLLNEMFYDFEIHCITIVHNPRGVQGTNFSYTNEFAFFVIPKGKKIVQNRIKSEEDISYSNLRNWGGESLRSDAKNCFYPIIVNPNTKSIESFGSVCSDDFHTTKREIEKDGKILIYPVDNDGIERKWRYARMSVDDVKDFLRVRKKNGQLDVEIGKNFEQYKTVWASPKYDANEYGTKIVKSLVPNSKFSFPKSLWNVYDCVYAIVGNDKNAIVLDYHAGSGTTAHSVIEINKKDNGNRQFIITEQMDYVEEVTRSRVQKVLENENIDSSFIYFELAKWNEEAKEQIENTNNLDELKSLFDTLYQKYFLNYNVKIKTFKEKIINEEMFIALPFEKQKEMFVKMLDLNQMYVNKSEMEDIKYGLSKEEINLTKNFYNEQ